MNKCEECGKTVVLQKRIRKTILCNNCANQLEYSSWIDRNFVSLEKLKEKKEYVVNLAKLKKFKESIIEDIEEHFNEYINSGFECSVNGYAGQEIIVFKDHCLIEIKSESNNNSVQVMFEDLVDSVDYYGIDEEEEEEEPDYNITGTLIKSLGAAKNLVGKKSVVKSGVSSLVSGVAGKIGNSMLEEQKAERKMRIHSKKMDDLFKVGTKYIEFKDIQRIEFFDSNKKKGYIRFIPKGINKDDIYNHEYFFYKDSNLFKSKDVYSNIVELKDLLNKKVKENKEKELAEKELKKAAKKEIKAEKEEKEDSFVIIKKYKNLLDEGIITEEEFNKKKKDLLDL